MNPAARPTDRLDTNVRKPTVVAGLGGDSAPEASASSVDSGLPAASGRPAPERRVSAAGLARVADRLSDRDKAVLQSVADYDFLTTTHLQALHFQDHASPATAARICRQVLFRLRQLGVLEDLDRRRGGIRAGSDAAVWRVGVIGDRLLRLASGAGARARRKQPSMHRLAHCLAVADTAVMLLAAQLRGEFELVTITTEPACWRPYLGASGERRTLKPDLYVLTADVSFEDHWYLEIDRGTESIPTLLRQCQQYETYRRSGSEQQARGVFPLVVWIVPDTHRADRLAAAIAANRRLDRSLYKICTPETLLDVVTGGAA